MNLCQKIITIYPELADFDFASGVIELVDNSDGRGPFIAVWNHPTLAQPTQAQLDAIGD